MPDTPPVVWSFFVAAAVSVTIVLAALAAALFLAHRRVVNLHRRYAARMLQIQDEERAWVAGEVHDDAVARVGLLRNELTLFLREVHSLPVAQRLRMDRARTDLKELADFLRGVARRLHPSSLSQGGLTLGLEHLADEVQHATGLDVTCDLDSLAEPPPGGTVLALYRIAQEALKNVATHARATRASLALRRNGTDLVLEVRDNGLGLPDPLPEGGPGIGLLIMRDRARTIGATLRVFSGRDGGTTVRVTVPHAGIPRP